MRPSTLEWGAEITLPSSRELRKTAHFIGGRYPCRSVAYVPRMILSELKTAKSGKTISVLDPFMGSGTTAIEAIRQGMQVHGLEVDPYARLISEVSTRSYSKAEIDSLQAIFESIVSEFSLTEPDYNEAPKLNNIEYWFEDENYLDLLRLKTQIMLQTQANKDDRRFLLAVLADIIRATSKAERQSLKPYISKKHIKQRNPVLPSFIKTFGHYISAAEQASKRSTKSRINWGTGDATAFELGTKVDCAITSPPYINAMDYVRCIKLESAWIGTGNEEIFSDVRRMQLGESQRTKISTPSQTTQKIAGPHLDHLRACDEKRFETALSYFEDIKRNLCSVRKNLKRKGSYHIIVGDSVMRGSIVPTHLVIANLAKTEGFDWEHHFKYPIKDHRTSIPRKDNGGKISEEHVITLRRS